MSNIHAFFNDIAVLPSLHNAFTASLFIAMVSGVLGWLVVLRCQTYAVHIVATIGFPGAAVAVFFGFSPLLGYFFSSVLGSSLMGILSDSRKKRKGSDNSVFVLVQVTALALGLYVSYKFNGFLSAVTTFLFGSLIGITNEDLVLLLFTSIFVVCVMVIFMKPLIFLSVDYDVARSRGVNVKALEVLFFIVLGCGVAIISLLAGSLLVFALLIVPAASAQKLTMKPYFGMILTFVFTLLIGWLSISFAYVSGLPIGFFISLFSVVLYVLTFFFNKEVVGEKEMVIDE